jgi:molecular chaperone GrpE (heat shock protein)
MEDRPKSAFDIAMARLDAMDREAGIVETPLSEAQKKEIAEARQTCAAQIAQLEILLRDALHKTGDPEARTRLEAEFQTDRRRAEEDRDRAIERIRRGAAGAPA